MNRTFLRRLTLLMTIFVIVCTTGCGTTREGIVFPKGTILRAGPDMTGQVYYMKDGKWTLTDNEITVTEGTYLVPPKEDDE